VQQFQALSLHSGSIAQLSLEPVIAIQAIRREPAKLSLTVPIVSPSQIKPLDRGVGHAAACGSFSSSPRRRSATSSMPAPARQKKIHEARQVHGNREQPRRYPRYELHRRIGDDRGRRPSAVNGD